MVITRKNEIFGKRMFFYLLYSSLVTSLNSWNSRERYALLIARLFVRRWFVNFLRRWIDVTERLVTAFEEQRIARVYHERDGHFFRLLITRVIDTYLYSWRLRWQLPSGWFPALFPLLVCVLVTVTMSEDSARLDRSKIQIVPENRDGGRGDGNAIGASSRAITRILRNAATRSRVTRDISRLRGDSVIRESLVRVTEIKRRRIATREKEERCARARWRSCN